MDTCFMFRLRDAMKEKGLTASELSRLSGVGKSDISYYLKGRYAPKQDKCYMLAKALGVDPGWLMTGNMPDTKEILDGLEELEADADILEALHQDPRLRMLFDRSRKMSDSDKEKMLQIADVILGELDR